jgi:GT2 family glycosyltransferase
MTANLLLRREVFNAIDGFDEQFDDPDPFREDTDLGWRAGKLGEIPFGHDVRVFHPPHARSVDREGHSARVRFFEKDALLLKKHPDLYKSLFLKEGHYRNTAGFSEHFRRGSVKYGVAIDEFYAALLTAPAQDTRIGHGVPARNR